MPVIKSAIKKLRQDKKREKRNDEFREKLQNALKLAKKTGTPAKISEAVSLLDKAAKNHIIHKNKAARLKSRLNKPVAKSAPISKITKKSTPKIAIKKAAGSKRKTSATPPS